MANIDAGGGARNRDAFMDLFESGWRVVPCRAKAEDTGHGKTVKAKGPKLGAGFHDRWARDTQDIEKWLRAWPDCVPGVLCGPQGEAWALLVVDIDLEGVEAFDAAYGDPFLLCKHIVRTASGGLHLFYRIPAANSEALGQPDLLPGVNTRGWHGYVIGAGSVLADGTFYEWEGAWKGATPDDLEPLPGEMFDRLTAPKAQDDGKVQGVNFPEVESVSPPLNLAESAKVDRKGTETDENPPKEDENPVFANPANPSQPWRPSDNQRRYLEMLMSAIVPVGKRSEAFADACWYGKRCGVSEDEVVQLWLRHPIGPGAKYRPPESKLRIAEEVRRLWDKPEAPAFASFRPEGAGKTKPDAPGVSRGTASGAPFGVSSSPGAHLDKIAWGEIDGKLVAEEREQPVDWIVRGAFEAGSVGAIVTMGGVGKTQLVYELARRRAFHGDERERLDPPIFGGDVVKGGSTLIVTAEDTHVDLVRRQHALGRTYRKDADGKWGLVDRYEASDERWRMVRPMATRKWLKVAGKPQAPIMVRSGKDGAELTVIGQDLIAEIIAEAKRSHIGVIVFDPFARFFAANSNAAEDVMIFIAALEAMADETGALILYTHHMTKEAGKHAAEGKGTMNRQQARFASRGSGHLTEGVRSTWTAWPISIDEIEAEVAKRGGGLRGTLDHMGHGKVLDMDDFARGAITKSNQKDANKGVATLVRDRHSGLMVDMTSSWAPPEEQGKPKPKRAAERHDEELVEQVTKAVTKAALVLEEPLTQYASFGGHGAPDRRRKLLDAQWRRETYVTLEAVLAQLLAEGKIELRELPRKSAGKPTQAYYPKVGITAVITAAISAELPPTAVIPGEKSKQDQDDPNNRE